ncbi:thioredoxin family protein [bacterium]|nr:thioredoxin family protein [bacterium]
MKFKNFITIFLIFVIPVFAFMVLNSGKNTVSQKAEAGSKPQIIKFTSQMCLDCKKLNETMHKVYPKYADDIILTEIQVQNNDEFTNEQIKKYNISLVPTVVILDKNGKKTHKIEGYIEEANLEKLMKDLCNE